MKTNINLRLKIPDGRSFDSIYNHYIVEKELARRIKESNSMEERSKIYRYMYDELFEKVPDHPRLTNDIFNAKNWKMGIARKMSIFGDYIGITDKVAEIAPGDGRFSAHLSKKGVGVTAFDISDQRIDSEKSECSFEHIVYDGYNFPSSFLSSFDVVVSDQLIEHLHPDDFIYHLEQVQHVLKVGGRYIIATPHRYSGPHDVSRYFSDKAECFHLKEYLYSDFFSIINTAFKSRFYVEMSALKKMYVGVVEKFLRFAPYYIRRKAARVLLGEVVIVLVKR